MPRRDSPRRSGRLILSDFAPRMVEAAQRSRSQLGITKAEFQVLDAERLALEDASIDGVLCRFGYRHRADHVRAAPQATQIPGTATFSKTCGVATVLCG
jgi:ubiquinone/menaquinone biosynthesis C-methylase UbiE